MIKFLRDWLFKDFWLKLFSLALATLLWFIISFTLRPVAARTFSKLPVIVLSSEADVRDFRVDPKEVSVTVQGDAKSLKGVQPRDLRAIVDLTGIERTGAVRTKVEVLNPPGITHIRVVPAEVRVIFPRQR